MQKLSVRLATVALSICVFICGTAFSAHAAGGEQLSSAQPSAVNLQQLPNLIDIPQTSESIEKVLRLENEGENLFKQRLFDKAWPNGRKPMDCH